MKIELFTGAKTIQVDCFACEEKTRYRIAAYYGGVYIKTLYTCNSEIERHEMICNYMSQTHNAGCKNSSLYVRIGSGLCFFYCDGLMIMEEEIYDV
jgi:hypothetical protein